MRAPLLPFLLFAIVLSTGTQPAAAGQAPVDTWIVSGQSNACGRAQLPGYEGHALVQMFDGKGWIAAKEPLPLNGTVGPWLAAATETAKAGVGVRITGWAQGGQPIAIWDDKGAGWAALKKSIDASGQNAGVFLWYQGENDAVSSTDPAVYQRKLGELVAKVRAEAKNPAMHVVIVQLGFWSNAASKVMEIREAQRQYVLGDPGAILVPAMGRPCDGVHLKKEGYFELGQEISRALRKVRYQKKDVDWPGPVLDAAILGADKKTVLAHFAEVQKLAGAEAPDFGVIDAQGTLAAKAVQAQNTRIALTFDRAIAPPAKLVYGLGGNCKATLVDEAGNRAPAVHLDIAAGQPPPDQPTQAPNGAGTTAGSGAKK